MTGTTHDKAFLWGGATAAYQCEGAWDADGKLPSVWDVGLHERGLPDADVSCDHYHRFREDIALAAAGGHTAYRFSLSWPRIISDLEGSVNERGIAHYDAVIDECLTQGLTPFVTLYHWDLPDIWEQRGGWTNTEVAFAFERYAKVCFEAFGDRVRLWTTMNEPKWYTSRAYFVGDYPPFHRSAQKFAQAAFNIMLASALGVRAFRKGGHEGSIGIVHSYTPVYGIDDSLECQMAVRHADNFNNNWVLDTSVWGEFPPDLAGELVHRGLDLSLARPEHLRTIRENTVDFLGLNYYSPMDVMPWEGGDTHISYDATGAGGTRNAMRIKGWFEQAHREGSQHTDWGMEVNPHGLYLGFLRAWEKYRVPLYITENGIGCHEDVSAGPVHDKVRIDFLNDHIAAALAARERGVDVRGFFVWSLMDLHSWISGMRKRYGLIGVGKAPELQRIPKDSYAWYRRVIEGDGAIIKRTHYDE